ncbi:MAG: ribonuclease Z [Prevotella sp.]|nr:ribonuclease Z [Prevotella sp.]MBQ9651397.1 ribonuclease Z [Prevotella sp.]
MEPFRVHILGCGSALPTLHHNASSQVVEVRGKEFMIDCGEGTQIQLRRSRVAFNKIQAVFLSHLHGDHCLGLIGMISTFGMLGRTAPLHIYSTAEFEPMLKAQLEMFCFGLEFDVIFHPVDTRRKAVIYEDRSLTIESIPLEHRLPCCGFLFREKPGLPHIRRDMIDFLEIPVSQINNIKNGAGWTTPEGREYKHEELVTPPDPVRSYAYCSDTKYLPELWRMIEGVDVLYHESTYGDDKEDGAAKYFHSTARQAATVARDAHVGRLLLGHYSARYSDERELLAQAREVFRESYLSNEGHVVEVKKY